MRIIPAIYGLFQGSIASPVGRRLSDVVEAVAECRAWVRARAASSSNDGSGYDVRKSLPDSLANTAA